MMNAILEGAIAVALLFILAMLGIEVMGVPLCRDASGVDRSRTQERIRRLALRFFERTLR